MPDICYCTTQNIKRALKGKRLAGALRLERRVMALEAIGLPLTDTPWCSSRDLNTEPPDLAQEVGVEPTSFVAINYPYH